MTEDFSIIKDGKKLRCGYTTGSCAAAAAKAAVLMLEGKKKVEYVEIDTPAGISLNLKVNNQFIEEGRASCSVRKEAGDDPDITDKMEIYASVSPRSDSLNIIDGGEGIGRIRRKGLFGTIGQAAINPIPREMINKEIRKISKRGYHIIIFAPKGKEISKKSYNKNIGIEGGISIIGSTGIVYPMSDDAIKKTIYLEMDGLIAEYGDREIILVPGNYGEKIGDLLFPSKAKVKISNYIGESISYAYNKGFKSMTLIGHIGKFSKLSLGVFNTHNRIADVRIEAFIYYLAIMGAKLELLNKIKDCLTAEEALNICFEEGYGHIVRAMAQGCRERARKYLKDENYPLEVIIFSMERGVLMG